MVSILQVIAFLKLIKFIKLLYIEKWDYQGQLYNLLAFLSLCKVSCDSPCCVKICGDKTNIDTHENVISDSEEEHIETK